MSTSFLVAPDGVRIVFDVVGEGPAIILLHGGGGGQTRQSWHQSGYVERLKHKFKVITMDIRGHGDSDKPTDPDFYTIEKMCQDIIAVADVCAVESFILWGFSFGGNIGRYLAAESKRIEKLIIMGIPFGLAASGDFRQFIQEFRTHWQPIVQKHLDGSLQLESLAEDDREIWQNMDVPVSLAWLVAMLDWGNNEPHDLQCPTLWLAGSENESTIASMDIYKDDLVNSRVETHIVEGLTHVQEFEEVALVFPIMMAFTEAN